MTQTLFKILLAACVALASLGGAGAAPVTGKPGVSSDQQGLHQWQVLNGKLILINGSYQDVLVYKRSLTFYFENKPGAEWLHVPIDDGAAGREFTWFSISQGEKTVADAAVAARGGGIELVIAETKPYAPAPIAVRRYRLTEAGDNDTDGPAYFFKKISSTAYPTRAGLTVEQVLEKEIAAKSRK